MTNKREITNIELFQKIRNDEYATLKKEMTRKEPFQNKEITKKDISQRNKEMKSK